MKLDNYIEQIRLHIKEYLPEEFQDAEILIQTRRKNNDVLFHEMILKRPDANSGFFPMLCLEDYYKLYQKGMVIENTMRLIGNDYLSAHNSVGLKQNLDLSYDQMRSNLFLCIINAEKNKERLSSLPHKRMEDLAVVYRVMVHMNDGQPGSILVNNALLEEWAVDEETLHSQALQNMGNLFNPEFCSLESKMLSIIGIPCFEMEEGENVFDAFVLTNDQDYYGASYLFCPDILKWVSEKMNGDFLIIPSSVHELIIMKESDNINISELQGLVKLINQTEVSETEYLSDNVYCYDNKSQTLSIAEGDTMQQGMKLMQ